MFDTNVWLGGKALENVADEAGLAAVCGGRTGTWATAQAIYRATEAVGARTADREILVEAGARKNVAGILTQREDGNGNDTNSIGDSLISRRHCRQAEDEAASRIVRQTQGADLAETRTQIVFSR